MYVCFIVVLVELAQADCSTFATETDLSFINQTSCLVTVHVIFALGPFHFTVELQWLEHLWNHENIFETGVVRANEG